MPEPVQLRSVSRYGGGIKKSNSSRMLHRYHGRSGVQLSEVSGGLRHVLLQLCAQFERFLHIAQSVIDTFEHRTGSPKPHDDDNLGSVPSLPVAVLEQRQIRIHLGRAK